MSERASLPSRWLACGLIVGPLAIGGCFRGGVPRGEDADAVLQPASAAPFVPGTSTRFVIDVDVRETGGYKTREHLVIDAVVTVGRVDKDHVEVEERVERAFGESDPGATWRNFEGMSVTSRFDRHGHLQARSMIDDTGTRRRTGDLDEMELPLAMPLLRSSYAPPVPMRVGGVWAIERAAGRQGWDARWTQTTYQLTGLGPCSIGARCATISMSGHAEIRPDDPRNGAVVRLRAEHTIDARDLRLLRSRSERIELKRDGRRRTTTVTVERRTGAAKRPPGMSTGVATLKVIAAPWAQVEIDGKEPFESATTPILLTLPTGRHAIRLFNEYAQRDEIIEVVLEDARAVTIYRNWCKDTPQTGTNACKSFLDWD
jgi:hypothetical protein